MEKKVLVICDTEKQYAVKLMEVLSRKNFGFQIHAFSDLDGLCRFAERTPIEILLIPGKIMRESLTGYDIGKIILLSDGQFFEKFSDYETIYKYQSAEHIMKEVLCYYAEYAHPMTGMYCGKKEFEVHGIFSPIGRCGKTALAESLAKSFGKHKKTLLLDLQSYCAREEQLGEEQLWDLTDIIYFLRQGKQTFLYKLGSIVRNQLDYDYVLPMKTTADLKSVTPAEWTELLEKLASDSDYQIVVIDFGQDVCGLFQVLSQCTQIYTPILNDADAKRKVENFEWMLKEENFEKVINSIHKINLPDSYDSAVMKRFMQEWAERFVEG